MKKELIVNFDLNVVSLVSVQKAFYRFMDEVSADITTENSKLVCAVKFKQAASTDNISEFEAKLRNEVLDNVLREKVFKETAELRNLVLGLAFSRSGIQIE